MNDLEKVAAALLSLTYGEMQELAGDLSGAMKERDNDNADIFETDEWASLLHGWAEANAPSETEA